MFYNKEEVDLYLNCQSCKQRYDVPRTLQCGEVLCEACINALLKLGTENLMCPYCGETHQEPANGFPVQKLFCEMLKLKPSPQYRGILIEELEKTLSELNERIEYLKKHIDDSDKKIKAHTHQIRLEIEAATQKLINQVEVMKRNIFYKLEAYEKKSLEDIKNTTGNFLEESNQKFAEIGDLMKIPNEEKIKDATMIAAELMESMYHQEENLDTLLREIEAVQFIEKSYFFNEAFIGVLNFDCEKASSTDDESILDELMQRDDELDIVSNERDFIISGSN